MKDTEVAGRSRGMAAGRRGCGVAGEAEQFDAEQGAAADAEAVGSPVPAAGLGAVLPAVERVGCAGLEVGGPGQPVSAAAIWQGDRVGTGLPGPSGDLRPADLEADAGGSPRPAHAVGGTRGPVNCAAPFSRLRLFRWPAAGLPDCHCCPSRVCSAAASFARSWAGGAEMRTAGLPTPQASSRTRTAIPCASRHAGEPGDLGAGSGEQAEMEGSGRDIEPAGSQRLGEPRSVAGQVLACAGGPRRVGERCFQCLWPRRRRRASWCGRSASRRGGDARTRRPRSGLRPGRRTCWGSGAR